MEREHPTPPREYIWSTSNGVTRSGAPLETYHSNWYYELRIMRKALGRRCKVSGEESSNGDERATYIGSIIRNDTIGFA